MGTYFMFGKYSIDAVGKISADRTEKGAAIIGDGGGEAKAAYALLGDIGLVLIADFPSTEVALEV